MKKQKLMLLSSVMLLALTSCGNSNRISRKVYNTKSYEEALPIHTALKAAQIKDESTTLFDNGGATLRYASKTSGSLRYEEMSLHDLSTNLSAGYNLYWSLKDNYLKVEGEKETHYFLKNNDDKKYYHLKSYQVGTDPVREKVDITESVEDYVSFKDYIVDTIDYYTTISIPFVFNVTAGITGAKYQVSPLWTTNFDIAPDSLYEKETHDSLQGLHDKYAADTKSGYSLDLTYGVENDQTCVSLKGKGNANDFHLTQYRQGTVEFDAFASFKNNFISQFEVILNGHTYNYREELNVDMDISLYISEEVSQNTCKIDTIDWSLYK